MTNRISEYDIEVYLNCIIYVTTISEGNLLIFQTTIVFPNMLYIFSPLRHLTLVCILLVRMKKKIFMS